MFLSFIVPMKYSLDSSNFLEDMKLVTCSHEIQTLASWKESYDKPRQHIKKQRHYFPNKGLVKAMVFPLVMYRCENWTVKKVECQRINAFELWCWRRLLNVP